MNFLEHLFEFETQCFNVDNQLSNLIDDIDSQLIIVKNSSTFAFFAQSFTLLKTSFDLQKVRDRVFTFQKIVS